MDFTTFGKKKMKEKITERTNESIEWKTTEHSSLRLTSVFYQR